MVNYMPNTLGDALKILEETQGILIAGGTDFMVKHRGYTQSAADERPWISLTRIAALKGIHETNDALVIGSATPLNTILDHPLIPDYIHTVLLKMASEPIRNLATLGGNILNASPAGDSLIFLYALDAVLELASLKGHRHVKIQDFVIGPGKTVIKPDEILVSISIPKDAYLHTYNGFTYRKIAQRCSNAISKISFFALSEVNGDEVLSLRMAYGTAGPTIIRSRVLEQYILKLRKSDLNTHMDIILNTLASELSPIDDFRSTSVFRSEVLLNLTRTFLLKDL